MKKFIFTLVALAGALVFSSCDSELDANHWGSTQYYRDFLFKECPPVVMEKTMSVSFNEDASDLSSPLVLALYRKVEGGNPVKVTPDEAEVYVNGEKSADNTISLMPTQVVDEVQKIKIGVVLTKSALESSDKDQTITYFLKMVKNPGLDFVNDVAVLGVRELVLEADPWTPMTVYLDYVANKLEVGVKLGFWIILIAMIAWIILARLVFWPATRFSIVYIDYHDGAGQRRIRMSGAYQLCLTSNKRAKDSLFKKIFKGSQRFEVNEFWEHDVIVKNGASRNSVRVTPLRSFCINGETDRKQEFDIVNDNGGKVTIITT